jgi:hypothetical protein
VNGREAQGCAPPDYQAIFEGVPGLYLVLEPAL